MTVTIFDNDDHLFIHWMERDKSGFVINTGRGKDSGTAVLHESGCHHIATYTNKYDENAFTCQQFIKVCSNDEKELLCWVLENRTKGLSSVCKTCLGEPEYNRYVNENQDAIDIKKANRISIQTYRITRDTKLSQQIKVLYDNQCQICCNTLNLLNGKTYAEAHHIKPLGYPHNGPDIVGNIICVCPNCHVKLDYSAIELKKENMKILSHDIEQELLDYQNELYRLNERTRY